jgi:hypothetical protein
VRRDCGLYGNRVAALASGDVAPGLEVGGIRDKERGTTLGAFERVATALADEAKNMSEEYS